MECTSILNKLITNNGLEMNSERDSILLLKVSRDTLRLVRIEKIRLKMQTKYLAKRYE